MKRVAWLALLAVSGLGAQEGQSWGSVQGVVAKFEDGMHQFSKHQISAGLSVGTWATDRWGVEVKGIYLPLENGPKDGKEGHVLGSVLYNFNPGGKQWLPYLAVGAGATVSSNGFAKTGEESNLNLHGGAGVIYRFNERWMLQADAKAVGLVTNTQRWEFLGLFGVGYTWGAARTKPAPAPQAAPPAPAPAAAPAPPPPPPPAPAPVPEPVAAAAVVPPPPPLPPAPEPPKKIVLDSTMMRFQNGKNAIPPEGEVALKKVADSLKAYKGEYTLVITGHTSSVGKADFNKSLSKKRAEAVKAELVKQGIPAALISTVGMGPDKPVADNKTATGQAKNRRVEIEIKTKEKVEVRTTEVNPQ